MKKGTGVMLGLVLAVSVAQAGQEGKGDVFWNNLMIKMQKVTPTRKSTSTTAVGGVRSAKSDESADIYWKGREKKAEIGEDELEKFNLALQSKNKGENAQALKHFEEFLSDYPNSTLRAEALQAVEKIRAEGVAAK